jgi:hypothetical protein
MPKIFHEWIKQWIKTLSGRARSWHEIIPARVPSGSTLRAQNNELIFGVSGDGAVTFGDVVILYTSNELIVEFKIPIVISP